MKPAKPNAPREPVTPRRRRPWILSLLTVLVVAALVASQIFAGFLNARFNIAQDVLNVILVVSSVTLFLLWFGWWLFFSRARIRTRIIALLVLIGIGFLLSRTIRVIPSGDVAARRVEFVLWGRDLATEVASQPVDLATTGPFDFPGFRGVLRDGSVSGVALATWESNSPVLEWKHPVGKGWSSFVAVNGYAVTMEQRQEFECVTCYEIATGELKWIHRNATRHEDLSGLGGVGPRGTPTIFEGKVYALGATGQLDCLAGATGTLLWSVSIPEALGIDLDPHANSGGEEYLLEDNSLAWGRSHSPLIVGRTVVVPGGGPQGGPFVTLLAFDVDSGMEVWRGGDQMVGYGSPSLFEIDGQPQILLLAESMLVAHDPETGQELWRYLRPGSSSASANTAQATAVGPNEVLVTKGYRAGGELIRVSRVGDQWNSERVWKSTRVMKTKFNSPVIRGDNAWSLSDGYLECVNVRTGESRWIYPDRRRGATGDRPEHGQMLLVGDKLIILSERGELSLVAADPSGYQELGRLKAIDGVCWNNLCLYRDRLLIRSDLEAACFRLPLVGSAPTRAASTDLPPRDSKVARESDAQGPPPDGVPRGDTPPGGG